MSRSFRTALMWLLLLALPLQGFAAATMITCGPNHDRMSAAAVDEATETHRHAVGDHRAHASHASGAAHADSADGDELVASPVHHLEKVSKFKCSACAACCMGVALPTAALAVASFPPSMTTAGVAATPYADFLADGLDPPPRLSLA